MDEPGRSIVREEAFEDELHVLIRDAQAADRFTEAAEWVLSANPHLGEPDASAPEVWVLPMAPIDGLTIWLFYTFDDSTVTFLALRPVD